MRRAFRSTLAAFLVTAVLAAPGGALASAPAVATVKPMPTMPGPAPSKGAPSDSLVEPKLSRDEAIAVARKFFTIPEELGEPNVGIQQSRDTAIWSLEWASPRNRSEQLRIAVTVDAVTGMIRSYSRWSSGGDQALQLTFTRAEAEARAQEWLERLVPAEYLNDLRPAFSPLNSGYWGGATYQFNWVRQLQGHTLANDGVAITIDARSGALTEYRLNWRPTPAITLPEQLLSQAEAESAYASQVPMVLQYQRFSKRGTDQGEWRLVYRPLIDSFPRMNQEGVLLDWNGEPMDITSWNKTRLVPAGDKTYQKPERPLEQQEALAIARAITGRTEAPDHSAYSEYGEEVKRRSWDFTWITPAAESKSGSEQRVRVDAESGLVVELSHWTEVKPFEPEEQVPVSLEEAEEKAIAFLQTHRPDLAGNLRTRPRNEKELYRFESNYRPTEYYIAFQQLRDGIPVAGRELQVTVNARTGEIRNLWSGWWDEQPGEQFPSPKPAISADQAMAQYLKHQGIEVTWSTFWVKQENRESELRLVWQPSTRLPVQAIDARSGALLDWEGRDLIEAQRYPSDIKGHYAEREIELLWARGVFELEEGKFNPDMVISADELSRWIVLARGLQPYVGYDFAKLAGGAGAAEQAMRSSNSAYFGAALQSGIILPEDFEVIQDLNEPVSRELFALWAVRAMGYGRIAKMDARIEMNFGDQEAIGPRYRNAVAILAGLGVVSGDSSGNYQPQRWLTRAEAAKILFAVSSR